MNDSFGSRKSKIKNPSKIHHNEEDMSVSSPSIELKGVSKPSALHNKSKDSLKSSVSKLTALTKLSKASIAIQKTQEEDDNITKSILNETGLSPQSMNLSNSSVIFRR